MTNQKAISTKWNLLNYIQDDMRSHMNEIKETWLRKENMGSIRWVETIQ